MKIRSSETLTAFALACTSLLLSLETTGCGTGNSLACDGKTSAKCGTGGAGGGGGSNSGGVHSTSSTVLKIEGTLIRDLSKPNPSDGDPGSPDAGDDGTPVILHGVNRSGTEYQCSKGVGVFDGPSDEASVRAIASWHVNAVRVPLNESCWLNINKAPYWTSGEVYKQAIQQYVALLHKYDIYPILELHWVGPGDSLATGQLPMPDADHAIDFWRDVAETFRDDLGVIFELYNEPYPNDNADDDNAWLCWRDGCTADIHDTVSVDGGPVKWQKVGSYPATGLQQLVSAVRETEGVNTTAHHVILLGGVQYSNKLTRWAEYKPIDPANNLGAAWHIYNFNGCANLDCFNAVPATLAASETIVATEFGEDDCQGTLVDDWMNWFDDHKVSYLAWSWNAYGVCVPKSQPWSLINDYTAGTPNSGLGQTIREHFAALASQ